MTVEGIFLALVETIQNYNLLLTNLLSFSSDTCNVMKGASGGDIAKFGGKQPKVIDIHCIYHLVSLVVKAATKILPQRLTSFFWIFTVIFIVA